jgi:hypothetical protein
MTQNSKKKPPESGFLKILKEKIMLLLRQLQVHLPQEFLQLPVLLLPLHF